MKKILIKNSKKISIAIFSLFLITSCATVQENANMVNCKYELLSVEPVDFSINAITFEVVLGVTNTSKTTAASIKRFDGDLYVNDQNISKIVFKDIKVEPGQNKPVKSNLEIPLVTLGKTLTGLVTMKSASVNYEVKGTAYLVTPIGDIPVPVTVYKNNYN